MSRPSFSKSALDPKGRGLPGPPDDLNDRTVTIDGGSDSGDDVRIIDNGSSLLAHQKKLQASDILSSGAQETSMSVCGLGYEQTVPGGDPQRQGIRLLPHGLANRESTVALLKLEH